MRMSMLDRITGRGLGAAAVGARGARATAVDQLPPLAMAPQDSRLFSLEQRMRLKGTHTRQASPRLGRTYVAGVAVPPRTDRAPDRPMAIATLMPAPVTITIAEVDPVSPAAIAIVQQYRWGQRPERALLPNLWELVWGLWRCENVLVDGMSSSRRLLSLRRRDPDGGTFDLVGKAATRDGLGGGLLAAVDGGRLRMHAEDGSPESREFWAQAVRARCRRTAGVPEFYIEPTTGDDGFLVSLALVVEAASAVGSRTTSQVAA